MDSLVNAVRGNVFEKETSIDEALVKEFYERNERKKEDEKWLKQYKPLVMKGLEQLGKAKADFGDFRASYTVPDNSKFDEGRVIEFLLEKGLFELGTKPVLDDEALSVMIEQGLIDFDELKERAWIEAKGAPRISIKLMVK